MICEVELWEKETFDLGRGASGLRTGLLLGFAVAPPSGDDFLLEVMLSRMLATRGCPEAADDLPEPRT